MKAFMMRHPEGGVLELVEAEVADGTLLLEIGSMLNPNGGPDLPPIVEIDFHRKVFRRQGTMSKAPEAIFQGGAEEPFPDRTVGFDDLTWTRSNERP